MQLPPPLPPFHPSLPLAAQAADPSRGRAISRPAGEAAGYEHPVLLPRSPGRRGRGQSFLFLKQLEGKDGACPPQFSSFQAAILQPGKNSPPSSPASPQIFPAASEAAAVSTGTFPFAFLSFSSKPSPRIFMSWIKPPSFLQLPAQCLGSLLPNLMAIKAKKTLQNTDDQKQRAVMLPFLAYAPWQHVCAKDSSKESCPASFPPKFRWKPPGAG